jgi:hypothetical protein
LSNPPGHNATREDENERQLMMNKQQMELGLLNKPVYRPALRRQRRLPGAHWWFGQMRLAVTNAAEWHAKPASRGEQIDLLCPSTR